MKFLKYLTLIAVVGLSTLSIISCDSSNFEKYAGEYTLSGGYSYFSMSFNDETITQLVPYTEETIASSDEKITIKKNGEVQYLSLVSFFNGTATTGGDVYYLEEKIEEDVITLAFKLTKDATVPYLEMVWKDDTLTYTVYSDDFGVDGVQAVYIYSKVEA